MVFLIYMSSGILHILRKIKYSHIYKAGRGTVVMLFQEISYMFLSF